MDTYKPLREIVFTTMRQAIIDGDFKPGQRLMEVQLADQMGVSRTPVREAIRKLELEGLVIMVPRKGAYVAGLSSEDIKEVVEIRAVLEGFAAKKASLNSTEQDIERLEEMLIRFQEAASENNVLNLINYDAEFHDVIYKSTKNSKLIQMINGLKEQVQRYRVAYFTQVHNTDMLLKQHRSMLDAIKSKDGNLARQIAEEHIATTEELIAIIEEKNSEKE
ncbi:FCD domain-containing protein [Alkalibaculum sp. M08DMB]|uniref:FCD domain-containing protein n=2 Tax=Alkalibaculum sporogenes TaxID=2655001 RepID=A0A6A7K6P9_9FIRM|nr:FCD domain-containing protein [Alkalibaculum sporogenes]